MAVLFYIGEIKNFAFFQTRKFSKNVNNINEMFLFFEWLGGGPRHLFQKLEGLGAGGSV